MVPNYLYAFYLYRRYVSQLLSVNLRNNNLCFRDNYIKRMKCYFKGFYVLFSCNSTFYLY